jgi:hypothetical protein
MLDYLLLIVALLISCVAGFYSISGLVSIFSGALIPVILMGGILEIAKVVNVLWLHNNWTNTKLFLKIYLSSAIFILMLITSIGIFGFLAKSHVSQSINSSEIQSKITIIDEQITGIKNDIKSNQTTLSQLDNAITQVVSQSKDENGATKALKIRNEQQKERSQINIALQSEQENINKLQVQEAPLQIALEKNEVDVGPIKYIAAMIFGDNPNKNLLERAVRYMIILLVAVFDPLAVAMLLASDLHKVPSASPVEIPKTPEIIEEKIEKSEPKITQVDEIINNLSSGIMSVNSLSSAEQEAVIKKLTEKINPE